MLAVGQPTTRLIAAYVAKASSGKLLWHQRFKDGIGDTADSETQQNEENELLEGDPARVCTLLFALNSTAKGSLPSGLSEVRVDCLRLFFVHDHHFADMIAFGVFHGAVAREVARPLLYDCLTQAVKSTGTKKSTSKNNYNSRDHALELWQRAAFSQGPVEWALVSCTGPFSPMATHRSSWADALLSFVRRRGNSVRPLTHRSVLLSADGKTSKLTIEDTHKITVQYLNFSVLVPTTNGSQQDAFAWIARNTWMFHFLK